VSAFGVQEKAMSDATLPSVAGLRTLVIGALEESGRVAPVAEIKARVERLGGFTSEQLARVHGAGPGSELHYRIRWALVDLRRSGTIVRRAPRVWALAADANPCQEA